MNVCYEHVFLKSSFFSKHLIGGHPNGVFGMSLNDGFNLVINIVKGISFDDSREIIDEIMFKSQSPVKSLIGLFFCHAIVDGQNERRVARLQKYGNWIKTCRLQPLNSISADL